MRRPVAILLVGVVCAAALPAQAEETDQKPDVVAGSKKFTESVILGEIASRVAETAGAASRHREQLGGTRVVWEALQKDEIDVYAEYTGTLREEIFSDRSVESLDALREALRDRGVGMSAPLGFENTYAIGMRPERADELGIEQLSDLKNHPDLTLGFTNEFMDREDGWPGLREAYDLPHDDVRGLDHDLAYRGLDAGDIDVIDCYSTDAEIEYYDLRILKDDRDYFPAYQAVWLYRRGLRDSAPDVIDALEEIEGRIDAEEMSKLNRQVKIDGASEAAVASRWVEREFGEKTSVETASLWSRLATRTWEHLFMVAVSMLAAILIAIPVGILAAKVTTISQLVLGLTGILQTIPSLALLVFMIPLFGIGTWPAIAALFLYSLLPIVRNTYAGLDSIPDRTRESARALGLPGKSIMRRVELPLAARSILAGIKTSVVINVGIATLGALIGAGGYGQPILTGIRLDDIGLILEGAIPAALLALVAQGFFEVVEWLIVPRGVKLEGES